VFEGYTREFPYSYVTERLARGFPRWTRIRKDPNSLGQQFLNVFGLMLEDIEKFLEEALNNQYIGTANLGEVDYIYKLTPEQKIEPGSDLSLVVETKQGERFSLKESYTLGEFYSSEDLNVFIVDYEENTVYLRYSEEYKSVSLESEDYFPGSSMFPHHIWNVFDEFALLLGLSRRHLERNIDLKTRILDVFKFPGNSTRIGLVRAIGRETGLVARETWKTGPMEGNSHILEKTLDRVTKETIIVNGKQIPPEQIGVDGDHYVLHPVINVLYNKDFRYRLENVKFNSKKELVLEAGAKEGYLISPTLKPSNLDAWKMLNLVSSGEVSVDIVTYDFEDLADQNKGYLIKNITSDIDLSSLMTLAGEVKVIVSLVKGNTLPVVTNLILSYSPREAEVSYVYDVELNALHDDKFRSNLFDSDGAPTPKLTGYVRTLSELVPIMWGQWKWDEGYWDVVEKNLMGLHVLPNRWDPRLGEISNVYFQNGIGHGFDLNVKFTDSWKPQIHSGYYYITSTETTTVKESDGEFSLIELKYPNPQFISLTYLDGASKKTVSTVARAERNKIWFKPALSVGTTVDVLFSSENYLYTSPEEVFFSGPTSQVVLPKIPLQDAPLIIEADGRVLKQVAFLDAGGGLTIENSEEIVGAGKEDFCLKYGKAFDVTLYYNSTPINIDDSLVSDNKVFYVLPEGQQVTVKYKVKDSFIVDFSGDSVSILFSEEYDNISVCYESKEDTAYYETSGPDFNPISSHLTSGFLFLTNDILPLASLEAKTHPDVIRGNGVDSCIIIIDAFDRWGNPVLNKEITAATTVLTDEKNPATLPSGSLVKRKTTYNRSIYVYKSPLSAEIPKRTDGSGRNIPCTATIVFSCGSISCEAKIRIR